MATDYRRPIPAQITAPGNSPSAIDRGRPPGILGQALGRLGMAPGLAGAPGLGGAPPPGLAGLPMGMGTPPVSIPQAPPGLPMAPPAVPPVTAAPARPMPTRTFPPGMTVNGQRRPVY